MEFQSRPIWSENRFSPWRMMGSMLREVTLSGFFDTSSQSSFQSCIKEQRFILGSIYRKWPYACHSFVCFAGLWHSYVTRTFSNSNSSNRMLESLPLHMSKGLLEYYSHNSFLVVYIRKKKTI